MSLKNAGRRFSGEWPFEFHSNGRSSIIRMAVRTRANRYLKSRPCLVMEFDITATSIEISTFVAVFTNSFCPISLNLYITKNSRRKPTVFKVARGGFEPSTPRV